MKGWSHKKLDELGEVGRGRSRHRPRNDSTLYDGIYPFFQTGDVTSAEFYLNQFTQTYNEVGLAQSKLWPTGTLCITIAANIAESAILTIPGCFPDSIVGFAAFPKVSDTKFVKYLLDHVKWKMQMISKGTTQDNLSLEKLLSIDFFVPSVERQREIASILSAYDDLIENNTRRIAVLEEMARRIFEEWFVHFRSPGCEANRRIEGPLGPIPEGWEIIRLRDLLDNRRDSTKPGEHLAERRYIPIDCIGKRTLFLPETKPYTEAQSSLILLEESDLLFGAMRPYFHKVCVAPIAGVTRSTCFVLRPRHKHFASFSTLSLFQDSTVAYASAHTQGATIPYAVWDGSLGELQVALPPQSLLEQFDSVVAPIIEFLKKMHFLQSNLRAQRDLLLPRLISGEIDVAESPALLEAAE